MRFIRPVMLGACLFVLAFAGAGLRPRLFRPAADVKSPSATHDGQTLSPQEWKQVAEAMRPVRPEQFKVLDSMADETQQKEKAKQLIAEQYRQFQAIAYPPLRKALMDEAHAQDQLFGAQLRFRNIKRVTRGARVDEKKAVEDARADVQQAVATLFDTQIAEKKVRLERLQSEVDRLQKNIDRMEQNKPAVVANWTNRLTGRVGRNTTDASPPPPAPPPPSTSGSDADEIHSAAKR